MKYIKMEDLVAQYPTVFAGIGPEWLALLWDDGLPAVLAEVVSERVFEFARITPLDIKAVIIGEHLSRPENQSVENQSVENFPPSLKNIFSCMVEHGVLARMPDTGCLDRWAYEGVLLIGGDISEPYIQRLIQRLGNPPKLSGPELLGPEVRPEFFLEGPPDVNWNVINEPLAIFTDGGCWPNVCKDASARAGSAVVVFDGKKRSIYLNANDLSAPRSNQRAEGYAIHFALLIAHRMVKRGAASRVRLYTDSKFWIDMIQKWMPRWATKERFAEKKNSDLAWPLWRRWLRIADRVELVHVPSHDKTGISVTNPFVFAGNDLADRGATYARLNIAPGTDFYEYENI